MRITDNMVSQQTILSLQQNLERLQALQTQISTGQKINQPSDDPTGTAQLLGYNTVQSQVDQYQRNLTYVQTSLQVADTAIGAGQDVLNAVKQIALGLTSGATSDQLATASSQVQSQIDQLVDVANTTDSNGHYIFSGTQTQTAAYAADGTYQGDDGVTSTDVGAGVSIARNLPGSQVFGGSGTGVDVFGVLKDLKTAIDNNDPAGIQTALTQIDQANDQVTQAQAEVSVRLQAAQSNQTSLTNFANTVSQLKSNLDSVDVTQAIVEFQSQQTALQAAEQASAIILQTSLLDFLK